jgi:hypothetical protein
MLFCSFNPAVDEMVTLLPMFRTALEVKRFDELGRKHDCVYEGTEANEGVFVMNRFIIEMKSCE